MTAALFKRWPELALALVYWATRLHRLTAYPVFDDESIHIRQAKMVWKFLPFSGADDGRVLNILLLAPFWPFGEGALWVSRAAYLFVGVAGFAAVVKLGAMLFGGSVGKWAGTVFVLLPYAFFFERIALADTLGIPLLALVALASVRSAARDDQWVTLLGGLALAGVILAKLNNLMFLVMPLLPFVLFRPHADWRRSLGRMTTMYLISAILLAPIVLFLVFRAHSTLGFANVAVRTIALPLTERVARQIGTLSTYLAPYVTWPIFGLCLVAAGLGLWQRNRGVWYVFGIVVVPVLVFVIGANSLESRYLLPVLPFLALLAGFAADRIAFGPPTISPPLTSAALLVLVGLSGPLQFLWTAWTAPERLALSGPDAGDYIQDWPSGFGVEAAGRFVLDKAAHEPVTVVVTEGWHIPGLTVHYGWEQNLHSPYYFSEPRLRIVWLTDGCDPFALTGDPARRTLLVAERFRYAKTIECLRASKTLPASFPKPGGRNVIDVFEIRPLP